MFQAQKRNIVLGPIASFNRWKEVGRHVKRGEKAIELCMPVTVKRTVNETGPEGISGSKDSRPALDRLMIWAYGKHHEKANDERVKVVIDTPKTATSMRDVDLSPILKKELRTRYLKARDKKGLVFKSREGTPLDPGNVVARWFHPAVECAIEKAEKQKDHAAVKALTGLHFHDHTFDSWLVASGQDILYVSAQMGRSTVDHGGRLQPPANGEKAPRSTGDG